MNNSNRETFLSQAMELLQQESSALQGLINGLDPNSLEAAVRTLLDCNGLVWVVGSGTSSSIARRLAHTLTCSGVRSGFLDPNLTQHGYSGILTENDVLVAISRGGETQAVIHLMEIANAQGTSRISITESPSSSLARICDIILEVSVAPENDAGGVIPLASTLAHAAIGDVLCSIVLSERGYTDEEFAVLHPAGAVGQRLNQAGDPSLRPSMEVESKLSDIRGFVLDMDGVLWRGDQPLPGLADFFQWLDDSNSPFVLATNNPSQKPEGFAAKAGRFDIAIDPSQVITSVVATVNYLQQTYPVGTRIFAMGEPALKELLQEGGFILADKDIEAVIIALDRALNYEMLKRATLLIREGAEFIGTNADPSYPTEEGIVPGSGTIVTAIAASSDRQPMIAGKPGSLLFDLALEKLKLPAQVVASVGDRLETDIVGGKNAGMKTILLLSGVADKTNLKKSIAKPDWVFNDLVEMTSALRQSMKQ